jgi:predicted amidohydrolase YtcJ
MSADLIIFGKVFTAEKEQLYADGFAVKAGKIVAVGTRDELRTYQNEHTIVQEYSTGIIVPGFTEGHAHISSTVELTTGPFVGVDSIEECQKLIKEFADTHPGTTSIMGGGFDPGLFGPEGPTADLIDKVVSDRAVILSDEGHHAVWVNTKAMNIADITKDTQDPQSGQISHYTNGEPSGFLQEMAIDLITPALPDITMEDYKDAILYYQGIGLSNGIVSAFEPMLSHSGDEPVRFDAYDALEKEGKLKITFRVAPTINPEDDVNEFYKEAKGLHKRFADRNKMQVNTVKIFVDGVVDGHTALLREPYRLDPLDCGPRMLEQEELSRRVTRALQEEFNVHMHAIGDAAIDEALNACEVAQAAVPGQHRNAITHLQVCQPDHPKRMKELGIVAVVNPYWHYETPLYEPLERPFLGKERAEHMYYLKSFLDAGIPMSQASDFPVTVPPDTMFCLHMMVNRCNPKTLKGAYCPSETIGVEDALRIMTIGGAYENFLDNEKGSIKVGKDADFVVLNQDVTTIAKEILYKTKVDETWIAGECCYQNAE